MLPLQPAKLYLNKGQIIRDRYTIMKYHLQWEGWHVFLATDTLTDSEVLLKTYPIAPNIQNPVLPAAVDNHALPVENNESENRKVRETDYLDLMKNETGFPRIIDSFQTGRHEALVLSKHGAPMRYVIFQNVPKFSMRNTVRMGWKLVNLVSKIHNSGYLHRDLSPSTIMGGLDTDGTYTLQFFGFDFVHPIHPAPLSNFVLTKKYQSLQVNEGQAYHRLDDYMSILIVLMESQNIRPFDMNDQPMIERKREFERDAYNGLTEDQYWMADLHTVLVDQRDSGFNKFRILKCLREAIDGFDPRSPIQYRWLPGANGPFINLNVDESDYEDESDDDEESAHRDVPQVRRLPIRVPHGYGM